MNRTVIAAGTIALTLCAPILAGAAPARPVTARAFVGRRAPVIAVSSRLPITGAKRTYAAAAPAAPLPFRPIVKFQNLWNSYQHAFHIRVEDSDKRVFLFKITDPKEYAEVQTILSSAGGAQTDGESISANPQAAAVAPE